MRRNGNPDAKTGILVILDGLGDRPIGQFDQKTPLEAARTPHLDDLARRGVTGLIRPIRPWMPVGTQIGSALLMGLAPADVPNLSRGPVEAAGAGLSLDRSDVAIRCNFASLEPNGVAFGIRDRRAGRIDQGTVELAEALDNMSLFGGVSVRFRASTQHRAVAQLIGDQLSPNVSDTDPGDGNESLGVLPCRPLDHQDEDARRTAALVNEFVQKSHDILSDHPINFDRIGKGLMPANGLVTRGAGSPTQLRNLISHLGLKACVISGDGTVRGLGSLFGFSSVRKHEFTATVDTDIEEKVGAALVAIEHNDLVFLHLKGTDVSAHDRDPVAKRDFLEAFEATLEPLLERDLVFAVAGDHSTDSTTGRHTGDPVPAVIAAPGIRSDTVEAFGERPCLRGGLGHITATTYLTAILDHMNVLPNYRGHQDVFIR